MNLTRLTIKLGVRWRLLTAPDSVSWHEGLCLSRDRREHAFLREALAVGAATVFRLVESGAANLATRQCKLRCDATREDAKVWSMRRVLSHCRIGYGDIGRTYLSSPTVSACYRGPLAWCGLGRCRISHRRAVARVHLRGRRQRTVRILHDGLIELLASWSTHLITIAQHVLDAEAEAGRLVRETESALSHQH